MTEMLTWTEWKYQVETLGMRAANCLYAEARACSGITGSRIQVVTPDTESVVPEQVLGSASKTTTQDPLRR